MLEAYSSRCLDQSLKGVPTQGPFTSRCLETLASREHIALEDSLIDNQLVNGLAGISLSSLIVAVLLKDYAS